MAMLSLLLFITVVSLFGRFQVVVSCLPTTSCQKKSGIYLSANKPRRCEFLCVNLCVNLQIVCGSVKFWVQTVCAKLCPVFFKIIISVQ